MDNQEAIEELKHIKKYFHVDGYTIDLVIQSLEKQIPKIITRKDPLENYKCPSCDTNRFWKDGRCCKYCGQLLDWRA